MSLMSSQDEYDVIIVGGGVNGCAIARELAPDHDVLLLEKDQIASQTTAKASGLITTVFDYGAYPEATTLALEFFREYDGTGHFSYNPRNIVELRTENIAENPPEKVGAYQDAGFDVALYGVDELEARYPDAFNLDLFGGAIEYREGGRVDPYTFATTLQADAEDAGVDVRTGVTVDAIATIDDAVTGIVTSDNERITAPTVVVAADWHSRDLVEPHLDLPIRPYRAQTLNLTTDRRFDDTYPITIETHSHLYWCPEHEHELHIGGGAYFSENPPRVKTSITPAFRNFVADTIHEYIPNIRDARISAEDLCPTGMAGTPDGNPIYDAPPDAPDGLLLATGSNGQGIMAAPMAAAAIRALLTDIEPPFPLQPFRLDRFGDLTPDFTLPHVHESPDQLYPDIH